jgi:hypothetical protein
MTTPVPAVLALWAAGYTATWIADALNLPDEKHVQRVLARAREIGDRRAVIHSSGGNTRKNAELKRKYPWITTIDVIDTLPPTPVPICRHGHRLTKMNTIMNASGPQCRRCKNLIHQRSRDRIKARRADVQCEAVPE